MQFALLLTLSMAVHSAETPTQDVIRDSHVPVAGTGSDFESLITLIQSEVAPESWEYAAAGGVLSTVGPTGQNSGQGGTRARANALADLIKQETSPHTWDINGGPGTISIFLK